jgi:serine/threonine-protein kinase
MLEPRRRFRFIKELSEGAFGKVYLAEMITGDAFKSVVAIKLLHGKWAGHEEIVQRSRDEARVLGLLHHRNIIRVDDLTSINGQCAIVMEYLDGVDLKTLITHVREAREADPNARFPRRVAFEIISQIGAALDAAYNASPLGGGEPLHVIHRDIKPSNVMVTVAGDVKVLDFGTAQARFDEREAHTQALAFGSAAYMAPERLLGDPDAPNGDTFSLGITLYEMLTLDGFGKIHIRPEKYDQRLERKLEEVPLQDLDPALAAEIRAFLAKILHYEAGERYTAAQVVDVAEDLAEKLHDAPIRRFCREIVKPCRDALQPRQDPEDPLTGSTVFEDNSSLRGRSPDESMTGELPESMGVPAPPPPPPTEVSATRPAAEPARSGPTPRPAPPRPEPNRSPGPTIVPPPPEVMNLPPETFFSAPTVQFGNHDEDDISIKPVPPPPAAEPRPQGPSVTSNRPIIESRAPAVRNPPPKAPVEPPKAAPAASSGGGSIGKIIAVMALLGLLALGGGAALVFSGVLSGDPGPNPEAGAKAGSKGEIGGRVIEVAPMDASRGKVVLLLQPPGKAEVSLVSPVKAEWDGSGRLELVGAEAGQYRTKVTPIGGTASRVNFEAVAGQACTYTFDVKQGTEWTRTGCEAL